MGPEFLEERGEVGDEWEQVIKGGSEGLTCVRPSEVKETRYLSIDEVVGGFVVGFLKILKGYYEIWSPSCKGK